MYRDNKIKMRTSSESVHISSWKPCKLQSVMAGRRVSKESLAIFDKYLEEDKKSRQLKRPEAILMLMSEFDIPNEQATQIFDVFDRDKNGIMSVWEFQQFHQCVGQNASGWVEKFLELDVDGSGKLDMEEARKGMATMSSGSGKSLDAKEIDFFLKTAAGEDGMIDMGQFVGLLHRLRVYRGPNKSPKKVK